MTKTEWSGWVQAIGSVAAIWCAVWIAGRQVRRARKEAAQHALIFVGLVRGPLEHLLKDPVSTSAGREMMLLALRAGTQVGEALELGLLPSHQVPHLVMVKLICEHVLEKLGGIDGTSEWERQLRIATIRGQCEDGIRRIDELLARI